MSLLSKLFGRKAAGQRPAINTGQEKRLCDWMLTRMKQSPMSAEEVARHVDNCQICGQTLRQRHEKRAPARTQARSVDYPTMIVVGIEGQFDLGQILFMARQEKCDLVVMGSCSPAFENADVLMAEAPKFLRDPKLVLVFEKFPSKVNPFCRDPFLMVRRAFLLEAGSGLHVRTLGELAIQLTLAASRNGLRVDYI